jgi:RimJ/RimL family protein N-acetyltransferase
LTNPTNPTTGAEWRPATARDAASLADLERDANLVALRHVFPPDAFPFPWTGVHARWEQTLAEPGVVVEVVDGGARLDAFLAHDTKVLRHLAVHPERWGEGLAREAVDRACERGARALWCLVDNDRARGFYERLGWRPTGATREAVWPPHPRELEYRLRYR